MEASTPPPTPTAQVAHWLKVTGLAPVGLALAEHAAPLSFLGAQALYVGQPFLAWVWPSETIGRWAHWLADPASLPALAQHLRTVTVEDTR